MTDSNKYCYWFHVNEIVYHLFCSSPYGKYIFSFFFPGKKHCVKYLYGFFCFNRKSFIWLDLGFTCVSFVTGALAFWAPKFLLYASKAQGLSDATESE